MKGCLFAYTILCWNIPQVKVDTPVRNAPKVYQYSIAILITYSQIDKTLVYRVTSYIPWLPLTKAIDTEYNTYIN